ncbi:hypothetical protein WJX73_008178 [Symbiochloris irregularis]|uniref:Uncharacterized protein n=1 Tax=Symbiochloris irregularis TaxID=706552 RepID=A0AAW1P4K8_9CHLO
MTRASRSSAPETAASRALDNLDILERCLTFLRSPEDFHRAAQWNTGDFRCSWLPQVGGCMPDVEVFSPPLIPWSGPLGRIAHVSGSFTCLTHGGIVSNAKCAVAHSKGLALDLAFLNMLNSRITYAPIRIPLVDHTANSAQVYPFIGRQPCSGTLTGDDFFQMVGMHPEVAKVASVDEIVGVKAVKAKYEAQLRDMRQMLVWRQMLDQQQQSLCQVYPPQLVTSTGRDKTAPYWRFVSCLEHLVAAVTGRRVLCIVCRSRHSPRAEISPVPVFWVGQSRHGHVIGLLSSAKFA